MPTIKSLIYHIVLIDCEDTKKYTIYNQYFLFLSIYLVLWLITCSEWFNYIFKRYATVGLSDCRICFLLNL